MSPMGPPVHYCPDCDCYPCVCRIDERSEAAQCPRRAACVLFAGHPGDCFDPYQPHDAQEPDNE